MLQSQHPDAKERERQAKRPSNKETTEELYNRPNEHQPNQIKPTDLISQRPQCLHPCHWMIPEACGDLTCQWLPRWLDRPPVLGPRWPAFSLPHIHQSSRFHNLVTTLLPFVGPWEVESTIAFYSEMFQISPTKKKNKFKTSKNLWLDHLLTPWHFRLSFVLATAQAFTTLHTISNLNWSSGWTSQDV